MKSPIEKPSADELRRMTPAAQLDFKNTNVNIVRYVLTYPPVEPGQCGQRNRTIECHLPRDKGKATWWECFGTDAV